MQVTTGSLPRIVGPVPILDAKFSVERLRSRILMRLQSFSAMASRQMFQAHRELWSGEPEIALLKLLCDPGKVSLDIGANRGIYTYWLARYSASVIAFEPSAAYCSRLRSASPPNVDVRQCAVSDATGSGMLRVPMVDGRMEFGLSTLEGTNSLRGLDARQIDVRKAALDDLGLSNVGMIKIDVEGHELSVLQGALGLLKRERPRLVIELEERYRPHAANSARELLERLGYQGFFLMEDRLHGIAEFDPATMQDPDRLSSLYINNFIFAQIGDTDWMPAVTVPAIGAARRRLRAWRNRTVPVPARAVVGEKLGPRRIDSFP